MYVYVNMLSTVCSKVSATTANELILKSLINLYK